MKKLLSILFLLGTALNFVHNSNAADMVAEIQPAINEGNTAIGASAEYSKFTDEGKSRVSLNVDYSYFFVDHLSVGAVGYFRSYSSSVAGVGPLVNYYYAVFGNVALDLGASYILGLTDRTYDGELTLQTGAKAFVVSNVAFGPTVSYSIYSASGRQNISRVAVVASFAIYL